MPKATKPPASVFTMQCDACHRLSHYVGLQGDFELDDPVNGKCKKCGKTEFTVRDMEKIQLLRCSDCKCEIRIRIDALSQDRMTGKVRCMKCFAKRGPKKSKRRQA